MSKASAAAAAPKDSADTPAAEKPIAARTLFVLDTTATPDVRERSHDMMVDGIVTPFKFEYGKPRELPYAIAVKFLRHSAFLLTDAKGSRLAYQRRPKQPDELGAGEQFKLGEDEVVARYDELSSHALQQRVLEMPDGDRFAENPKRDEMIAFIVAARKAKEAANKAKEPDIGEDDFVPEADADFQ